MSPSRLVPASVRWIAAVAAVFALAGCSVDEPVVLRDTVAPAAPRALYSVTGDGSVALHWVRNSESDLVGYRVYIAPAFAGPYTSLGTAATPNYIVGGLANGATWYFAVSAYDVAGNESDLSTENVYDTPRPAGTNVSLNPSSTEPGGIAGYDFSSGVLRLSGDPSTDMFFQVSSSTRLMVARDLNTDIQDAGYHPLDDLDWAPDAGWSPTGTVELAVGHAYYLWTRDNHYAKFRVVALSDTQVKFDWAYQVDAGNPQLARHPRSNVAFEAGEKRPSRE
ncbi:MAG: fibronectin type III domain-containing protein [Candidatus Eisenbacteria bacterium]